MQLVCSLPSSSSLGEEGAVRVQVAQQAQEILGTSDLVIITERVDDVALLIGQMVHIAPCGRTLQPSPLEAYVPRLITSPSS